MAVMDANIVCSTSETAFKRFCKFWNSKGRCGLPWSDSAAQWQPVKSDGKTQSLKSPFMFRSLLMTTKEIFQEIKYMLYYFYIYGGVLKSSCLFTWVSLMALQQCHSRTNVSVVQVVGSRETESQSLGSQIIARGSWGHNKWPVASLQTYKLK